jgi:hypothetical protein
LKLKDVVRKIDGVMTFPILVEACNGQFVASLAGAAHMRAVEATRSQAIESLKAVIEHRMATGELLPLEIETVGVSTLAGKYSDDPTLGAICDDAYQTRDADRGQ